MLLEVFGASAQKVPATAAGGGSVRPTVGHRV
jgi:hypothetical protein